MIKLEIGQEVWGYIESPVNVCGTDFQGYGSVERLEEKRYRARKGGRADGTGFEDHYPNLQQAMVAAGLPLDAEAEVQSENMLRIRTVFG